MYGIAKTVFGILMALIIPFCMALPVFAEDTSDVNVLLEIQEGDCTADDYFGVCVRIKNAGSNQRFAVDIRDNEVDVADTIVLLNGTVVRNAEYINSDNSGNIKHIFYLKDGASLTIHCLPASAKYEISEDLIEKDERLFEYQPRLNGEASSKWLVVGNQDNNFTLFCRRKKIGEISNAELYMMLGLAIVALAAFPALLIYAKICGKTDSDEGEKYGIYNDK